MTFLRLAADLEGFQIAFWSVHQVCHIWGQLLASQILAVNRQGKTQCATDCVPKAVLGFQSSKNIWQIGMLEK